MSIRTSCFARLAAAALTLLLPATVWGHGWELAIVGVGEQPLDITNCRTFQTTHHTTHAAQSFACDANFTISYESRDGADTALDPGVTYILTFLTWKKSVRLVGTLGEGGQNPDNAFRFENSSTPPVLVPCGGTSTFPVQDLSGWPDANCLDDLSYYCQGDPFAEFPPATQSVPLIVRVAGQTNGVPDPASEYVVVARDPSGAVVQGAVVEIEFGLCSDTRLCSQQEPGTLVVCAPGSPAARRVARLTDASGRAAFHLIGATTNTGASPGAGAGCAQVRICGNPIANPTVAVYDQNGGGVNATDLSLFAADKFSGLYFGRSDYDGNGVINVVDQSMIVGVRFGNKSLYGCSAMVPSGSYCP